MVEKYEKIDPRVKLIRQRKNTGPGGARNTGIRMAKADYIASVDGDDSMLPNMLKILWQETHGKWFDVVCCGFNQVDVLGNVLSFHAYPARTVENSNNNINIFSFINPAFWNKLWRKSLFIDHNIYFPHHDLFQDMSTIPRLLAKSNYIKVIDARLYQYLVRSGSITNTYGANIF